MLEEITSKIKDICEYIWHLCGLQALADISARLIEEKSGTWMYFNLKSQIPDSLLPTAGINISLCDGLFYFWKVCCFT